MNLGLVCQAEPGLRACQQLGGELLALGVNVTLFTAELPAPDVGGNLPAIPLCPRAAASK